MASDPFGRPSLTDSILSGRSPIPRGRIRPGVAPRQSLLGTFDWEAPGGAAAPEPAKPAWDYLTGLKDLGQGILNVTGAGAGAIAGGVAKAFGSDAYERALVESAEGVGIPADPGIVDSLRAAPGAGRVIAEALAPGTPETAAGRIGKNVGGLIGDIATDPINWAAGGLPAASRLGKFAATGTRDVAKLAPVVGARAADISRSRAALEGAAALGGSATAGLVYAPEIVGGTIQSGRSAVDAYLQGDLEGVAEHGTQAALTGLLGGATLAGLRHDAGALRGQPADAGASPLDKEAAVVQNAQQQEAARQAAQPAFDQEFAPPAAPERVNWTPEQEALYRQAFERRDQPAPVPDQDFGDLTGVSVPTAMAVAPSMALGQPVTRVEGEVMPDQPALYPPGLDSQPIEGEVTRGLPPAEAREVRLLTERVPTLPDEELQQRLQFYQQRQFPAAAALVEGEIARRGLPPAPQRLALPPGPPEAGPPRAPEPEVAAEPVPAVVERTDVDRRAQDLPVTVEQRRAARRAELAAKHGLQPDHPAIVDLERTPRTDPLTGLGNKLEWEELQSTIRPGVDHALVLDMKKFKPINDRFGHGAGDLVLKKMGAIMREVVGDRGEATRFGGDEFGAVLRNMSRADAEAIAREINARAANSPTTLRNPKTGETLDVPGFEAHIGIGEHGEAADIATNEAAAASRQGGRGDVPVRADPGDGGPVEGVAPEVVRGLGDREPELAGLRRPSFLEDVDRTTPAADDDRTQGFGRGALDPLPAPPPGHVRLYRGETNRSRETPRTQASGSPDEARIGGPGRWYTRDAQTASNFAETDRGTVGHVDLPEEEAARYLMPSGHYFVPEAVARGVRPAPSPAGGYPRGSLQEVPAREDLTPADLPGPDALKNARDAREAQGLAAKIEQLSTSELAKRERFYRGEKMVQSLAAVEAEKARRNPPKPVTPQVENEPGTKYVLPSFVTGQQVTIKQAARAKGGVTVRTSDGVILTDLKERLSDSGRRTGVIEASLVVDGQKQTGVFNGDLLVQAVPLDKQAERADIQTDERPTPVSAADRADGPRDEDRAPLAAVPAEDGGRAPEGEAPEGSRVRRPGTDVAGDNGPDEGGADVRPGVGAGARGVGAAPERGGRAGARVRPDEPEPSRGRDYRIQPSDEVGSGGPRQKAKSNIEAIRILKTIEKEGRLPTADEQRALVKYSGWGGLPQVFDPYNRDHAGLREDLKGLLTDEEWESARASTPNAHYTAPAVIDGMWKAMQRLGLSRDANVLEPSMGAGHFFGLQPDALLPAKRTGVELDSLTGRIASLLYPDSNVNVKGFEAVPLPDNFFDLAISNVPFGNYPVHDPKMRKKAPALVRSIHDYFFAKALDKVRPGGVVAFITSNFTMDKTDSTVRKYLASQADLLGAIRLPNTAFKANAGTEVTTDVIFLQKRAPGAKGNGVSWTGRQTIEGKDGARIDVNEYFAKHPEMMLGQMALEGSMYGRGDAAALVGTFTPEAFAKAVENLPEGVLKPWETMQKPGEVRAHISELPDAGTIKDNGYGLKDGKVVQRQGDTYVEVKLSQKAAAKVKGMLGVRDAVRSVFKTQMEDAKETSIVAARNALNRSYDAFVKAHGPLSAPDNRKAFDGDPDAPLLLSLEDYNPETGTAKKRDVFSKRTIERYKPVATAGSASDALTVSLNETGRLDWDRMQALTGRTPKDLQAELGNLAFKNPDGAAWQTAEEYLSGDVRQKLAAAEAAARADKSYARNVEALKAVQPRDLEPGEIDARLGSSWVPKEDVQAFLAHLLDVSPRSISVGHAQVIGAWTVKLKDYARGAVGNTTTWGTDRYDASDLVADALNAKVPTIYFPPDSDGKRTVDQQATIAAREQQQRIKDEFKKWLWSEPDRADRLARKYNEEFNNTRLRAYDGSHLTFPGMARGTLRGGDLDPHQKNAVWRQIQDKATLLAHVVGAGKTFEMAAAAMELRRLGLARKPMFVVPNHLVEQWGAEFLRLYPSANVLAAGKEHFQTGKRQQIMSRIATGSYDAVIVGHKSFEALPVTDETFGSYLNEQIRDLEAHIEEARNEEGKGGATVKELEKAKKRLEAKLQTRANREAKDTTIAFEELGVDAVFLDEAHLFKNLFFPTKMTQLAGVPQTESGRAFDMFIKTNHVRKMGGRITFATGTPLSNTMAEMFTMQRYLQPEHLRTSGMQHFDSWAQNFGESVTGIELAPDGSGYRSHTRFARFTNLPELVTAFRQVADVQTAEMLKLPRPKVDGGKRQTVAAPASGFLKDYVQTLMKRAEAVRAGKVDPSVDNMLKITGDGAKAALDMRLVDPSVPDDPNSKLNQGVRKVFDIWQATADKKSTQLVFIDLSTPADKKERGKRFTAYDDMKSKLVKKGVPEKEIAFIHDAETDMQKQALFDAANAGRIRILFGSTEKMGAGTNVQRKLVALHHMDAPWRPSDIEQREGRILRQGNENENIKLFGYVTEGSFDAYKWQTLETKARFIGQVMQGDVTVRNAEDVSGGALTYAEVKAIASGNPAVMEKVKVDAELRKLDVLRAAHESTAARIRREIVSLPGEISAVHAELDRLRADVATRDAARGEKFSISIQKKTFEGEGAYDEADAALAKALLERRGFPTVQKIGEYLGFDLMARGRESKDMEPDVWLQGEERHRVGDSAASIAGIARELHKRVPNREAYVASLEKKLADFRGQADKPFEHADRITELVAKQKELDAALDLDKADKQAGATGDEGQEPTGRLDRKAAKPRYSLRDEGLFARRGEAVIRRGDFGEESARSLRRALDARTKASDKNAIAIAGDITIAHPYDDTRAEVEKLAPELAGVAGRLGDVMGEMNERIGADARFAGLSTDADMYGVALKDRIRLSLPTILDVARERVQKSHPDASDTVRKERVLHEAARLTVEKMAHEVTHVKADALAAKNPALAAGFRAKGGHGKAFHKLYRQVMLDLAPRMAGLVSRVEEGFVKHADTLNRLWSVSNDSWESAGHGLHRGKSVPGGDGQRVLRPERVPPGGVRDGPGGVAGRGQGVGDRPAVDLRGGGEGPAEPGQRAPLREGEAGVRPLRPIPPRSPYEWRAPDAGRAEGGRSTGKPSEEFVNLDRASTDEDLRKLVSRVADARAQELGTAKSYRSWDEAREKAVEAGLTEADFNRMMMKGGAVSDHIIEAGRMLRTDAFKDSQEKLRALVEATKAGKDTSDIEADYEAAINKAAGVLWSTVRAGAEAGRALAIHRKMAEGMTEQERLYRRIAKGRPGLDRQFAERFLATDPSDSRALAALIRSEFTPSKRSMAYEFWINGLLSGPPTHFANILGNSLAQAGRIVEKAAAGAIDAARVAAFGGTRERFVGEVFADMHAIREGLKKGTRAMGESWRDELAGFRDDGKVEHAPKIPGRAGEIIRTPTRALTASDAFFKAVASTREAAALAYRKARKEGHTGDALKERIGAILGDLEAHPDIARGMAAEADYQTFTKKLGTFGTMAMAAREADPTGFMKVTVPFFRTPLNIAKYTLERTPLNFIRIAKLAAEGKLRDGELSEELAKATTGTVIGMGLALMASEGLLTGGGPSDPRENEIKRKTGWQPYSIHVGDQYVSYQRLEPFSSVAGFAADLIEVSDEKSQGDLVNKIVGSVAENLTNKTFLQGLENAFLMWNDPRRYASQWAKNLEGSVVPAVFGRVAQAIDPTLRETGALDGSAIVARIPGASMLLDERRSATGEPMRREGTAAERILSPLNRTKEKGPEADLEREFLDADYVPSRPSRTITVPGSHGRKVELSDEEYRVFVEADREVTEQLRQIVRSPTFKAMDPLRKKSVLRGRYQKAQERAARRVAALPSYRAKVAQVRRKGMVNA